MDDFYKATSDFESTLNTLINCTSTTSTSITASNSLFNSEFNSSLLLSTSTISPYSVKPINKTVNSSILLQFQDFYEPIHGYLSLAVCFFGTITNILNIIVLTRKDLISATNTILTGLAVADMAVMIDYIPFTINNYFQINEVKSVKWSYTWAVYTLVHSHFSIVLHTISTWLTISLAIWRHVSVKFPTQSRSWCTLSSARWLIVATYIVTPIFCVPQYLSFRIKENCEDGEIFYLVDWSDIALSNGELLRRINFWVFSVCTKLVPCILLTYLSWALINAVYAADRRKRRLKENCYTLAVSSNHSKHGAGKSASANFSENSSSCKEVNTTISKIKSSNCPSSGGGGNHTVSSSSSSGHGDRTTRMLLAILLLFLATEFPIGCLTLLNDIYKGDFITQVYNPLASLLDMLALINSAVNFVLYCIMSEQFRHTFAKLFFL